MKDTIIVTEGIEGTWHYYLSKEKCFTRSLCNERVMKTNASLKSWGLVTHLKEKYCEECCHLYREILNEEAKS